MQTVVVVGASLAGLRAAEELRRRGSDARIVMVGADAHRPYDRPPLSKQLLAGTMQADATRLVDDDALDALQLDWMLGARAVALDVGARTVTLADGTRLGFDGLVVATGATPRTLPGTDGLAGVHTLRTLDDALAIRDTLDASPRVVVVGAGFIGSEVASTCRARGLEVTVLEALPSPLQRGLGPLLGGVLAGLHRDHGVDLQVGVGVAGFEGTGRVERVVLDDGRRVDADLVVVGVGVEPETAWLEGSGLPLDRGLLCDATCLAAPGIVAAGDVVRWPHPLYDGALVRLEHWTNAAEQGAHAGARLLAADDAAVPFGPVPYVWSDQFGLKIQVTGLVQGDDEMEVVSGSLDERRFVAVFGRAGLIVGAVGIGRPRVLMRMQQLVATRTQFAEAVALARADA